MAKGDDSGQPMTRDEMYGAIQALQGQAKKVNDLLGGLPTDASVESMWLGTLRRAVVYCERECEKVMDGYRSQATNE